MTDNEIIHLPKTRKMDLSEEVSVTMPAHIWISFWASYGSSDWSDSYASAIAIAAQEKILDPDFIIERKREIISQRQGDSILSLTIPPYENPSKIIEEEEEHRSNYDQGYL